MLQVKLPVVDRTQPQSDNFATGVENKATGDSKLKGGSKMQVTGRRSQVTGHFKKGCLGVSQK